jgi:hypothetical protein
MDVKEGHPGSLLYWLFDTDQGTQHPAQLLMMLHGTDIALTNLVCSCVERQASFDDALGPEILLALFDPGVTTREMVDDGILVRSALRAEQPARFLFAGQGQAYPMLDSLTLIGKGDFRSERPGGARFEQISNEISRANGRAAPFFQQAFDLNPLQNYLIIAHRTQRSVLTFDLGERLTLSTADLLTLITRLRPIARHSQGQADLDAIALVVNAAVTQGAIKFIARLAWNTIRPRISSAIALCSSTT